MQGIGDCIYQVGSPPLLGAIRLVDSRGKSQRNPGSPQPQHEKPISTLRSDTHHKMRVWLAAAESNIGIRFSKMRLFSTEFSYRKETSRPVSRNRFPRRGPRKMAQPTLFIRCLRFLFAEFLEARIIPERIEHWIEPEQRGSERHVCSEGRAYGIESSFCKAAMARSGSPIPAATRARISIAPGPSSASFSIGRAAIALSTRANAAALSPRPILVSARSPIRLYFPAVL